MGAVALMIIGMLTVFCILLIVINLGKLLIMIVNRIAPEAVTPAKKAVAQTTQQIDQTVKAVIDATISQITGGKGHVKTITKI